MAKPTQYNWTEHTPRDATKLDAIKPFLTIFMTGVMASPRMSVWTARPPSVSVRISFPYQISETLGDLFSFAHTHPLGGVDVPSEVYET